MTDDRYTITLLDIEDPEEEPPHRTVVADVRDYEVIRPYFDGQDAVVHLALIPRDGRREVPQYRLVGTPCVLGPVA